MSFRTMLQCDMCKTEVETPDPSTLQKGWVGLSYMVQKLDAKIGIENKVFCGFGCVEKFVAPYNATRRKLKDPLDG